MRDGVGAAHQLVPPLLEAGVLGIVDAVLPEAQAEGGVLAGQVVDVAVVGLHAQHPQVGVRRLEVGDGGVVVLLAELLDDGEAAAVAVLPGGLGLQVGRQRREQPPQLGEDGGGGERRGPVLVGGGQAEEPHPPRAGGGLGQADVVGLDRRAARGEDDPVELQVGGAAIAEAGQGQPVVLRDPLRHRPEEDGGQPLPLQAAEHLLADGGEPLGDHPPGGQHHPGPRHGGLGGQLHGVVGGPHDEDVLVDQLAGEAVDLDPLRQRGVDGRGPHGVADVGAVGHHAGPGPVGAFGGGDLQLAPGPVDRLDGLAEADVDLVLADQLRVGHRRRRLQDPYPPEPAVLGGDGHRQPTRVPADDHQVVGRVTPRTRRHRCSRLPCRRERLREPGAGGPTPEG